MARSGIWAGAGIGVPLVLGDNKAGIQAGAGILGGEAGRGPAMGTGLQAGAELWAGTGVMSISYLARAARGARPGHQDEHDKRHPLSTPRGCPSQIEAPQMWFTCGSRSLQVLGCSRTPPIPYYPHGFAKPMQSYGFGIPLSSFWSQSHYLRGIYL